MSAETEIEDMKEELPFVRCPTLYLDKWGFAEVAALEFIQIPERADLISVIDIYSTAPFLVVVALLSSMLFIQRRGLPVFVASPLDD